MVRHEKGEACIFGNHVIMRLPRLLLSKGPTAGLVRDGLVRDGHERHCFLHCPFSVKSLIKTKKLAEKGGTEF